MPGSISSPRQPVVVLCVLVVAVAVGAALGTAGAVAITPGEPISFYGGATDTDGVPAPEGTVIVGAVDGTEIDRITVDEVGVYASDGPTDEKLRTQTQVGDTVTFHVGDADGPQATETHDIDEPGAFELELTFPAGTFAAEDSAPPGGGGGGGGGGGSTDGGSAEESSGEDRITVELPLSGENVGQGTGEGGVVSGSIAVDAGANSTVQIDLVSGDESAGSGSASDQTAADLAAAVESISIDVAADVALSLEVSQSDDPTDENALEFEPDDGTLPVGYLQVETNLTDDRISNARIDFRLSRAALDAAEGAPEDVAMYHFDEESGEWEELPTVVLGGNGEFVRFRAETGGFSQFAVGVKRPQFEVVETAVDGEAVSTGSPVEVEVTVANTGGAEATFTATLLVEDEAVDRSELSLAPNATGTTDLEHVFDEPGTYQLRVNDVAIGEIGVEAPAVDSPEDESSAATEQPSGDDREGGAVDESAGAGGLQGVGPVAALVAALVVLALLGASIRVWRNR